MTSARVLLRRMFDAAIDAAQPVRCLPPHLPSAPNGRTIVVGAGKASAAMAKAFDDAWTHPVSGLVVTRYGCGVQCSRIEIVEARPCWNGADGQPAGCAHRCKRNGAVRRAPLRDA